MPGEAEALIKWADREQARIAARPCRMGFNGDRSIVRKINQQGGAACKLLSGLRGSRKTDRVNPIDFLGGLHIQRQ